jgi:hypothetical protein
MPRGGQWKGSKSGTSRSLSSELITGTFHKYLVYTDSAGNMFFARGGPSGWLKLIFFQSLLILRIQGKPPRAIGSLRQARLRASMARSVHWQQCMSQPEHQATEAFLFGASWFARTRTFAAAKKHSLSVHFSMLVQEPLLVFAFCSKLALVGNRPQRSWRWAVPRRMEGWTGLSLSGCRGVRIEGCGVAKRTRWQRPGKLSRKCNVSQNEPANRWSSVASTPRSAERTRISMCVSAATFRELSAPAPSASMTSRHT